MIGGGVTSAVANIALGADPAAISTWFFTAVDSIMARVSAGYAQSRRSGSEYMRAKATMAGASVDLRAGSLVTDQVRTSLEVTGPVAFKTAVRAGANDEEALLSMATQMSGSAQRHALAGDRDVLEQTLAHGKGVLGYRRVLGGPGCGFCAMLASRGAVYLSRESASTARSGLKFHDHCRCHVEPMFRHEPDPPDVQRLKRQWQRVTAGQTGKGKATAWRNYWEQPTVDRSQLRLAASKAGPPSPVPGPPVPAPGVVVRSALDAKRTLSGLEIAWQAEAKRITGRDLAVSIPAGTSLQTAKEYAEGVLRGLERFPDAALERIRFGQLARDEYAQAGNHQMTFNQRWSNMANRRALVSGMQEDIAGWSQRRDGWSTRGDGTPMALSLHEFAHILDIDNLGESIHSRVLTLAQRRATLQGIGNVDDLVARDISIYATSDAHELIAEAFADVMLRGQAASPLARDIFDLLEAEYFKSGGRITPAFGTFPAKAAPNLAKMTVPQLRALAAERGVTLPAKALKADIVRALEETPAPIVRTPAAARMTAAEFDARASAAAQGRRIEDMPQVRIQIDASAGSDTSKWRAVEARGLTGPPSGLLSAATRRVRSSGPFNERLRFPEGRPLADWEIQLRAGYSPEMRAQIERMEADRRAKEAATADRDIKALDRAMEQSPLPSDVIVWRGGPASDIRLPTTGNVVGHEWVDPGYLGTSANRSVSEHSFAGGDQGVLLRILAPEGTPAIGIAGGGEAEILLGRGLRYRVVADGGRTSTGARVLDVEIVPKAPVAVEPGAARWLGNVDLTSMTAAEADRMGALVQAASRREILDEIVQLRADGASARALANRITGRSKLANNFGVQPQVDDAFRDELLAAVDNGTIDDVVRRHLAALDVKPAPVVEKPLAKRTVAELRALAKERDITLPPKATKAQIVEALQAPPLSAAEKAAAERKALREAARERNRQIEQATGTARLLAEVDELLVKKAEARVIRQRLDPKLIDAEQVFANADPAVREALAEALASGDLAKVRAAVTRLTTKAKLKVVGGKAGAKVKFDPDTMEFLGAEIADGTPVTVVTRGASVTLPDGTVVQVRKAQVTAAKPGAAVPKFEMPKVPAADLARARKLLNNPSNRNPNPLEQQIFEGELARGQQTAANVRWLQDFQARYPGVIERIRQEAKITDQFESWRRRYRPGATAAEVRTEIERELRRSQVVDAPIVIRRGRESTLLDILESGRLKTQFETGTSGGTFDNSLRSRFESITWGYERDLDPRRRPIYGYLSPGGVDSETFGWPSTAYGSIRIVLKDSVRERTSITFGDSLSGFQVPSAMHAPDWKSFNWTRLDAEDLQSDFGSLDFQSRVRYIEAQIHGGVSVDDIAEVVFDDRNGPSAELRRALKRAGIPWRIAGQR